MLYLSSKVYSDTRNPFCVSGALRIKRMPPSLTLLQCDCIATDRYRYRVYHASTGCPLEDEDEAECDPAADEQRPRHHHHGPHQPQLQRLVTLVPHTCNNTPHVYIVELETKPRDVWSCTITGRPLLLVLLFSRIWYTTSNYNYSGECECWLFLGCVYVNHCLSPTPQTE